MRLFLFFCCVCCAFACAKEVDVEIGPTHTVMIDGIENTDLPLRAILYADDVLVLSGNAAGPTFEIVDPTDGQSQPLGSAHPSTAWVSTAAQPSVVLFDNATGPSAGAFQLNPLAATDRTVSGSYNVQLTAPDGSFSVDYAEGRFDNIPLERKAEPLRYGRAQGDIGAETLATSRVQWVDNGNSLYVLRAYEIGNAFQLNVYWPRTVEPIRAGTSYALYNDGDCYDSTVAIFGEGADRLCFNELVGTGTITATAVGTQGYNFEVDATLRNATTGETRVVAFEFFDVRSR